MSGKDLKLAVVTGGHSYDVQNFTRLFRGRRGIDAYVQHMDDFGSSSLNVRRSYDVVLFFIMLIEGPVESGLPWYAGNPKAAIEQLGDTPQGIVILHHSILAYPKFTTWNAITGIHGRSFGYHIGEKVHLDIAKADHPITSGLKGWDMTDETYTMADAGDDSEILLTINHPKSMKTIAWTRKHKNSRVFCFQSGHDSNAWSNDNFREVLFRGVQWTAQTGAQ